MCGVLRGARRGSGSQSRWREPPGRASAPRWWTAPAKARSAYLPRISRAGFVGRNAFPPSIGGGEGERAGVKKDPTSPIERTRETDKAVCN